MFHVKQRKELPEPNCFGLAPSVDGDCEVLVLGSMPGVASLSAQQYYAFPANRFWPIMAQLLEGAPEAPAQYEDRLQMLLLHRIALWDAIASCYRPGSLDSAIENEKGNDFTEFLSRYPRIHTICCNGGKSYACFKRWNKNLLSRPDLEIHKMPSTSPANARWRMPDLLKAWGEVISPLA